MFWENACERMREIVMVCVCVHTLLHEKKEENIQKRQVLVTIRGSDIFIRHSIQLRNIEMISAAHRQDQHIGAFIWISFAASSVVQFIKFDSIISHEPVHRQNWTCSKQAMEQKIKWKIFNSNDSRLSNRPFYQVKLRSIGNMNKG